MTTGLLASGLLPANNALKGMQLSNHLTTEEPMFFKISLAEWSFHKAIFGQKLDHLDFAAKTKSLGIDGVEYVNLFFRD